MAAKAWVQTDGDKNCRNTAKSIYTSDYVVVFILSAGGWWFTAVAGVEVVRGVPCDYHVSRARLGAQRHVLAGRAHVLVPKLEAVQGQNKTSKRMRRHGPGSAQVSTKHGNIAAEFQRCTEARRCRYAQE